MEVYTIEIRRATESDFHAIWEIFHRVVAKGDTYPYAPDTTQEEAHSLWMSGSVETYVASESGKIVGTYILKPNQPGLGSHVANAGFMVDPEYQGKGVGKTMAEHAIKRAKERGFLAMQFNFVVSTNPAVALWKKLGFVIVGTLPKGFRHQNLGLVDAYVMHRFL